MLLHVARVRAGGFAVLVFYISQYQNLVGGYIINHLPRGLGITKPLHAPEQDQVYRS